MSVTIDREQKFYTWESCNLTWEQAIKTWGEAATTDFLLKSSAMLNIADSLSNRLAIGFHEKISLQDYALKAMAKTHKEQLYIKETYWDNIKFKLSIAENIQVSDNISNHYESFISEQFAISDYEQNNIGKNPIETLHIIEQLNRGINFKREFAENLSIEEKAWRNVETHDYESFALFDAFIDGCNGVLSNISISEEAISLEEFLKNVNLPPGYNDFIKFKVGEYEYQEALVRITMNTAVQQVQPTASNVIMHVDILDTDDRGTVMITDTTAPTKVYFNKHYYKPPEVNVTIRGGNTGDGFITPNIVSTDGIDDRGRYFEVELLAEDWLTRKQGQISWISKGY